MSDLPTRRCSVVGCSELALPVTEPHLCHRHVIDCDKWYSDYGCHLASKGLRGLRAEVMRVVGRKSYRRALAESPAIVAVLAEFDSESVGAVVGGLPKENEVAFVAAALAAGIESGTLLSSVCAHVVRVSGSGGPKAEAAWARLVTPERYSRVLARLGFAERRLGPATAQTLLRISTRYAFFLGGENEEIAPVFLGIG